jgi:hypothetical protein
MARTIGKLTPAKVKNASKPGLYGDGGGLYLSVGPTGGKSWIFRYMLDGKAHAVGLGALHTIGLADARGRATTERKNRQDGIDPLGARIAKRQARRLATASAVTFKMCAGNTSSRTALAGGTPSMRRSGKAHSPHTLIR